MKYTAEFMAHYVKRIKLHDFLRASTNDREFYWKKYWEEQNED